MWESLLYVLAVFIFLFLLYVCGRLVSAAYFRSKREYLRELSQDAKGGKDDGI